MPLKTCLKKVDRASYFPMKLINPGMNITCCKNEKRVGFLFCSYGHKAPRKHCSWKKQIEVKGSFFWPYLSALLISDNCLASKKYFNGLLADNMIKSSLDGSESNKSETTCLGETFL